MKKKKIFKGPGPKKRKIIEKKQPVIQKEEEQTKKRYMGLDRKEMKFLKLRMYCLEEYLIP